MGVARVEEFRRRQADRIERLYRAAGAAALGLALDDFAAALARSADGRFGDAQAGDREVGAFLDSLRVADLALAAACERGREAAWKAFVSRFRPLVAAMARKVTGENSRAREISESLYADLYGVEGRDGERRSLLRYFHGRSSLATWLRAVVAQRAVDEARRSVRFRSLDDADPADVAAAADPLADHDPQRPRYLALVKEAIGRALDEVADGDRLRLSYYYVQRLTLAEVGRLLGEHESTVSRKLERTCRVVRKRVERTLRGEKRLSEDQIRLCYEYATEEWPFELEAMAPRR